MQEQEIDWVKEIYGRGYPRIDREYFRRRKRDFWSGLNGTGSDGTLMMEWERTFGSALELVKPFLKLTGRAEEYIACPGSSNCGCAHYVSETLRGELVATCQCDGEDDWDCQMYQLEPEDVLVHGLDWPFFGEEIRKALGFAPPAGAAYVSRDLREIGTYGAVAAPVYLSLAGEGALLRELAKLQGLREGPFLVLTATGGTWSEEVEAMARPHGGGHISLSSVLLPDGRQFRAVGALQPMLEEFAKRLAKGKGLATMVERIEGNLQAIAKGSAELKRENAELRTAKQRLEKMLAEGMFAFTDKIDAASFKVFCAIMADGNVATASRTLATSEDSVRGYVRRWSGRGKEYQALVELVRWRKKSGGREKVPLNDAILHDRAHAVNYPELLSDVLDGLLSMSEENWEERCQEVSALLRPIVREAGS